MSNNISQHEGAPPKDLGFGTTATSTDIKLINKDGTFNVRRKGLKFHESFHFYHYLITIPWWKFHVIIFSYFLVANLIFSSIFMFIGPLFLIQICLFLYFEPFRIDPNRFTDFSYSKCKNQTIIIIKFTMF
jgi:hypothetical protein